MPCLGLFIFPVKKSHALRFIPGGTQIPTIDHVIREDIVPGFVSIPIHQCTRGADILCAG